MRSVFSRHSVNLVFSFSSGVISSLKWRVSSRFFSSSSPLCPKAVRNLLLAVSRTSGKSSCPLPSFYYYYYYSSVESSPRDVHDVSSPVAEPALHAEPLRFVSARLRCRRAFRRLHDMGRSSRASTARLALVCRRGDNRTNVLRSTDEFQLYVRHVRL